MAQQFIKDPSSILDYTIDWSEWLDGDTISTSVWTAPDGITVVGSTNTTDHATVWLSGGTAGRRYSVVNRIVTAAQRTDERTLEIMLVQR